METRSEETHTMGSMKLDTIETCLAKHRSSICEPNRASMRHYKGSAESRLYLSMTQ